MSQSIDSRQLRAFAALARTSSFTLAAKELFLSQSAVSHSIKALESELGCRLLDRMGKKVALTLAGEQLLRHTEKILHEMHAARSSLEQLGKWGINRLRIGASATACQYLLPSVLREFKKTFPQFLINISPGDTTEAEDLLHRKQIDLALTLEPQRETTLEFLPIFSDEMWFVMDPQHPWAVRERVEREEIPRQNYVLYARASYTFRLVEDYFRDEDMELNLGIELGDMEAIKELVKLGLGISILAPWIVKKELGEKSLVALPLGRRKLKRQWGILLRRGKRPTLAEETFVRLCREQTKQLVV